MRFSSLRIAAIALAAIGTAIAFDPTRQPLADIIANREPPRFSEAEWRIISRNASLERAVVGDPWVVRQFLDALGEEFPEGSRGAQGEGEGKGKGETDPDLKRYERSSPEAAHDLLQIIKRAGAGQGGTARRSPPAPQ